MSAHTIAEAVEITGLTAHTLRYYERDGLLLTDVDRDSAGRRLYSEGDLTWIELVTKLRSTGMPIRDVRRYAELVRAGEHTQGERLALLRSHRAHVMEQLAEITDHLGAIDRKIGIYEDRLSVRG
ncbi:MerR family transcriptional regulator [Aeromicrobium sp. Root495]|uniref:MerR family transcriptional regulator n=1 Tax=Aeromicrobium sp. Root495 TaxID=1736550 RepID=UPI0006F81C90|nr:MerR family transcriptional regulator [Aeromicrobium sp. Root495]KQY55764.1 MerR family transcriptional regulator [Aeromicrobium sp. Root495]